MQSGGLLPSAGEDAERLEPARSPTTAASAFARQPGRPAAFPLTDAQKEIWLACQMGPEASCAFNEGVSLRLHGPLDVSAVRQSLEDLVAAHDALRTTFDAAGEIQRVGDTATIPMCVTDLADWKPADAEVGEA